MTTPRIWIKEIEFNDSSKITFSKNDIIVFVGPNNAGKSVMLREITQVIQDTTFPTKITRKISIEKQGSESDLILSIENFSKKNYNNGNTHYSGYQFSTFENSAKSIWKYPENGYSGLAALFVNNLMTEQRLTAVNPPSSIQLTLEAPQHPIHFLQKSDELEIQFSQYFNQAFGLDLIVHRNAGSQVPLYVGKRPTPKSGEDRVSEGYLRELEKLDLLHEQGDGMRSFVGVLLNAFISKYSILLIDEPEAFLHPPQARLLGKMLANNIHTERQQFFSTHSESFLKGLLDANTTNLKVIRIQRKGNTNNINILNNDDINKIWSDSLLRHSNILDGLFHSKVVICESDSDSRFFSAILSSLHDEDSTIIFPDILFINCGGKHRLPIAINALKKLNVPIKSVVDFDVLNNMNPLKNIYEACGGSWVEIENDWKIVKKGIEDKRPEFLAEEAKEEIKEILDSVNERVFPKSKVNEIQKVFKKASAWTEAKTSGKTFIPSGDATQAFNRLQLKLKEIGILIPEIGELEGFVRSIGGHGPKWVNEVLTIKDLKNDPELREAREFVMQFLD